MKVRSLVVVTVLMVLAVACDGAASEGNQLTVGGLTWEMEPLPPGQEFVLLLGTLKKTGPGEVEILSLSPIRSQGMPEVAELVAIEIGPRGADHPPVPQSAYITHPPAIVLDSGKCGVQELRPASGFRLKHDQDPAVRALLATHMRAVAPGEAIMEGIRVRYRSDGEDFFQDVPLTIEVTVSQKAPPYMLTKSERRCRGIVDVLTAPAT
jgi:hypothetical protein